MNDSVEPLVANRHNLSMTQNKQLNTATHVNESCDHMSAGVIQLRLPWILW